jgi:hypothetical protein
MRPPREEHALIRQEEPGGNAHPTDGSACAEMTRATDSLECREREPTGAKERHLSR